LANHNYSEKATKNSFSFCGNFLIEKNIFGWFISSPVGDNSQAPVLRVQYPGLHVLQKVGNCWSQTSHSGRQNLVILSHLLSDFNKKPEKHDKHFSAVSEQLLQEKLQG
jgi:hypothetical protein